ncbi:hypothetical protein FOZ61_002408 [Perkinsus olseni]|uniref:Choline transporter-like protein n=1 Tax=Perkinsus olseni TaxID=32597 RepID=A0A7J6LTN7_PEROL|nr:hypothetical protein FOZ61_002408 [Perkinsus olseni]KAF4667917.1 hypothetical protein FOL46_002270 [Perkinsus olseni]
MARESVAAARRKNDIEVADTPSHGFTPSIKWNGRSRPGSLDYCCIAFFWSCALTQLICGIVIASSTNYTHPVVTDPSQLCPSNYNFALADCVSEGATSLHPSLLACVDAGLCDSIRACYQGAATPSTMNGSRILQAPDAGVAADLWEALADYWYIPTTIFPSMVLVAVLWLLASEYIPRVLIWSTLATSIVFLIALWAFWNFEYGFNNWMLLVIAGLATVSSAILYKSINCAAEVLSVAACGLRCTPSVVLASLLLKGIFVAYVLLWTFFMVRSAQTKELDESNCSLRSSPGIGFARFLFGLLFWVFTYVFLNMKTVVCAAGIGAWYFPGGDGEPTIPALRGLQWAFTTSSGAVMFAATIVGVTRFILNRIGNACHCLPWFLTPLGCLWKCLTCCCMSILEAFSKFMIIGQVFAGGSFCGAGRKSFRLIKNRLGNAFITDGVGHTVVTTATYLFSFSLGVASWLWLDAAQEYQTLAELNTFLLIPVLLLFAAFISTPIFTIVVVTWLSPLLHGLTCGEDGCDSSSQANAQRAINSVTGALFVGSVCFAFFHFLADVVLCSIDTVFFCFAIEADARSYQHRLEGPVYSKFTESLDLSASFNDGPAASHCQSTPCTSCEDSHVVSPGSTPVQSGSDIPSPADQALFGYTAAVPAHTGGQ